MKRFILHMLSLAILSACSSADTSDENPETESAPTLYSCTCTLTCNGQPGTQPIEAQACDDTGTDGATDQANAGCDAALEQASCDPSNSACDCNCKRVIREAEEQKGGC